METIKLWEKTPCFNPEYGQPEPTLEPFLLEDGKEHGCIIICPGGGYVMKAAHDGAPVARRFNALGFHAFVLEYRVAPYRHPVPLLDAQRAVRLIRFRAKEFAVKPDKIAILGFSAGGHLSAHAGTVWDMGNPEAEDPIERVSCRPDAFVPCFAVNSLGLFHHQGSADALLGRPHQLMQERALSAENLVTEKTPPAFIWHTVEDEAVPVENSLRLAKAMVSHGVPVSLHIFPYGGHGVVLGREDAPLAEDWPELLRDFLSGLDF